MSDAVLGKIATLVIALGVVACSGSSEEEIDKRPAKIASIGEQGAGNLEPNIDAIRDDGNTVVDETTVTFSGVNYQLAAGSEQLDQAFYENVALVSKVSEGAVILFGRNGSSWLYGGEEDELPRLIQPLIGVPEGQQLLTMDASDFWLVSSSRASKRRFDEEVPANQIVLHNFDLSQVLGQRDKLKILGATHQSLFLHLVSHIVILSVVDGETAAYEFSAEFPGGFEGEIRAAGETTEGGYWFATENRFAILNYRDQRWHWNFAEMPSNLNDYSSLAARLDLDGQRLSGDSVAFNGRVHSLSGAPMAFED